MQLVFRFRDILSFPRRDFFFEWTSQSCRLNRLGKSKARWESSRVARPKLFIPYYQKNDLLPADEITYHVKACARNDRDSQKKIYTAFYGYAMSVCERYTNNHDDAVEILNDGFLKIFKEIHRYTPAYSDLVGSFTGWLRKIMVYTAIDHFRRNQKHRFMADIDDGVIQIATRGEDALDRISYDEILRAIQEITPGYRTVFNLFIIEGFSHEEIAEKLGISVGTSKSNLSKARKQVQKILLKEKKNSDLLLYQWEKRKAR